MLRLPLLLLGRGDVGTCTALGVVGGVPANDTEGDGRLSAPVDMVYVQTLKRERATGVERPLSSFGWKKHQMVGRKKREQS